MDVDNGLTIGYTAVGKGSTATLTAKMAGKVLAVEKVDLAKPKAREAFADALCEGRLGIDGKAMRERLLAIAAEVANGKATATDGGPSTDGIVAAEIDVSRIVRPEQFITRDVCGLSVPTVGQVGDKPVGRWVLYLQWADGRRECRAVPRCIDLPDERRLFVDPQPAAPTATTKCPWSRPARERWLKGGESPDPSNVFKQLCERIAFFLHVPNDKAQGGVVLLDEAEQLKQAQRPEDFSRRHGGRPETHPGDLLHRLGIPRRRGGT